MVYKIRRGSLLKEKSLIVSIVLWIFTAVIGLIRMNIIHSNELAAGRPTMTGTFTFLAYLIIAIIGFFISLIIFKINSVKGSIFIKLIKIVINIAILIISFLKLLWSFYSNFTFYILHYSLIKYCSIKE